MIGSVEVLDLEFLMPFVAKLKIEDESVNVTGSLNYLTQEVRIDSYKKSPLGYSQYPLDVELNAKQAILNHVNMMTVIPSDLFQACEEISAEAERAQNQVSELRDSVGEL